MATIVTKTTNDDAATAFAHHWGWLLALSLVQIIAGSVAIAVPVVASLASVAIFGAVLIATAVFQLIHAFQVRAWPRSAYSGFGGILYAAAGSLVVLYPFSGALALAVLIGVLLIADGAVRTMFGMIVRPLVGWGWLVASGFGSIVVGVILLTGWPATALWATGLLLGVNLIFGGAMNAALALSSRMGAHQGSTLISATSGGT